MRGQQTAHDVLQQTTEKGKPYEGEVVELLQEWSKAVGAEIEHVGMDNRPGDVVVRFTPTSLIQDPLTIVVEARCYESIDNRKGRSARNAYGH